MPEKSRPKVFIAASAIGIYKDGMTHTEASTAFAGHFAAQVIAGWEESSVSLPADVRRIVMRFGLVIDKRALLIRRLSIPHRFFAGGPAGSGKQPFPFVHLKDVTGAIRWAMERDASRGIYNLTAPHQITHADFSRCLAKKLGRPSWLPVPGIALKLLYGQAAQMILESPAIVPERLIMEGYPFLFPDLNSALSEITGSHK